MISIITCSRTPQLSQELQDNIAATIGCEYELVTIDNSQNKYNIFQAYNEGVRRAKGNVLCFCHDDIMFRSNEWGNEIEKMFTNQSIGLIGVAGSHFMSSVPMYWWSSPYIAQYNLENDHGVQKHNITIEHMVNHLEEVATVDGLCFFIPHKMFNKLEFDEKTYSNFHAYDMDICMQVQLLNLKVYVTDVILIEHYWSESSFKNEQYMAMLDVNMRAFVNKWSNMLPIVRGINISPLTENRLNNLYKQAYESTCIRRSYAYRLGKSLLHPSISNLKRLIKL